MNRTLTEEESDLDLVEYNGLNLECLPEERKTHAVCLAAVKENGLALKWVSNQTLDIIYEALEQNPTAKMYINKYNKVAEVSPTPTLNEEREKMLHEAVNKVFAKAFGIDGLSTLEELIEYGFSKDASITIVSSFRKQQHSFTITSPLILEDGVSPDKMAFYRSESYPLNEMKVALHEKIKALPFTDNVIVKFNEQL